MIGRRETAINIVILTWFSLMSIAPLCYVAITAVTPAGEAGPSFGWPSSLDLSNFVVAWTDGNFSQYIRSSLIVTISVVIAASILSSMTGFALAKLNVRAKGLLLSLFLVGLLVPIEGYVIPLYFEMRQLQLLDSYLALILPQIAQSLSFGTYWMRNAFRGLPTSLLQAAYIDGAGDWRALWRILVPTVKPAIATMAILLFMWTWNDFLLTLVMITSDSHRTVPAALAFFKTQHTIDYATMSAASILVAIPVVILYLAMRRQFIQGMLAGALRE